MPSALPHELVACQASVILLCVLCSQASHSPNTAAAGTTSGVKSSTSAPAAAAPAGNDPVAVLDKQVKALGKKVRQCISLLDRQKAGEPLNPQELEKLSKMQGW